MNERRRNLVLLAFHILDSDNSGEISLAEIKLVYNAKSHPDVVTGRKTEDEVLTEFMEHFAVGAKNKKKIALDHVVTQEEFLEYYSNLSASIDNDDYFELMIRNAWHISGGQGQYANTTNRRVLVTHSDGRQSIEEIKDDLKIGKGDTRAMMQNLKTQGSKDIRNMNLGQIEDMKHQIVNEEYEEAMLQQAAMYQQQQYQQQQQQQPEMMPQLHSMPPSSSSSTMRYPQPKRQQQQQQYQQQYQQQPQQLTLDQMDNPYLQQHERLQAAVNRRPMTSIGFDTGK
jgi:hypothetical protein